MFHSIVFKSYNFKAKHYKDHCNFRNYTPMKEEKQNLELSDLLPLWTSVHGINK